MTLLPPTRRGWEWLSILRSPNRTFHHLLHIQQSFQQAELRRYLLEDAVRHSETWGCPCARPSRRGDCQAMPECPTEDELREPAERIAAGPDDVAEFVAIHAGGVPGSGIPSSSACSTSARWPSAPAAGFLAVPQSAGPAVLPASSGRNRHRCRPTEKFRPVLPCAGRCADGCPGSKGAGQRPPPAESGPAPSHPRRPWHDCPAALPPAAADPPTVPAAEINFGRQ